jgi:hypothetical protein
MPKRDSGDSTRHEVNTLYYEPYVYLLISKIKLLLAFARTQNQLCIFHFIRKKTFVKGFSVLLIPVYLTQGR